MFQPGVAIVEGNPAIESLIELDFGAREAEAPVLRWDLETTAIPLHDVVVTDHSFMNEGADALQVAGSRTPGFGGMAGGTGKAAIVVGDERTQHGVGGVEVTSLGQAQFTAQAILQQAPEAFDAALGLGRVGGEEGDAELLEGAAELSGLAFAGELFVQSPVIIVAHKDAAAIAVKSKRNAEAAEHALEQVEIAFRGFGREELGREDFAGSVVLHAESGKERAAAFQPVMGRTIELDEFAFTSRGWTALAMSGRTALAR